MHSRFIGFGVLLLAASVALGQTPTNPPGGSPGQPPAQARVADVLTDQSIDWKNPAARQRAVERIRQIELRELQEAREIAKQRGKPIREELPDGRVREVVGLDEDGELRYYYTLNANAAISTGANLLYQTPYLADGSGVIAGVWDADSVRDTHQEFNEGASSRVTLRNSDQPLSTHATHVAGTIAAYGVSASAKGMAPAAKVDSYDWTSDTSEMTAAGATAPGQFDTNIYLSNHSYGYAYGWLYDGGWTWLGTGTDQNAYDPDFGQYSGTCVNFDNIAFNAPYYTIFWAAGNENNDGPANGATVTIGGNSVVYDSSIHPPNDGDYRNGFETIGDHGLSKNIITVGAANDGVTDGQRDPSKATIASFSSTGPCDDGRIKPDVVANGVGLNSTTDAGDANYGVMSGTSMASPNACGSATLLVAMYKDLFLGGAMLASTLKGLLIHTASDIGNPGPDYTYGWGLINVKEAADIIMDHEANLENKRMTEDSLTTSVVSNVYRLSWDGVSAIRATLCWTDPAGVATSVHDDRTPKLVNDLDLKIIAPDGTEYLPWVMPFVGDWSVTSMSTHATNGTNSTDNVEQIVISDPAQQGIWQVVITHKGTLTNNEQVYSLLQDGLIVTPLSMDVSRGGSTIAVGGVNGVSGTAVGTGSQISYTISNVGGRLLELTTPVTISAEDNCAVTVNEQPSATISAFDSSDLIMTVTPAAEGTWSFGVSIANNDPDKDPYTWTVTGIAGLSGVPLMVVTRGGTFLANGGTNAVSETEATVGKQLTYAIENLGDADLTLTTPVTISGESNCTITVSTQPGSPVAAAGSTNLVLSVTPSAAGVWSASISIANNDADKNPYTWTINGTALGRYSVTYDANNADSGSVPTDPDSPYLEGNTVTALGNTGNLVRAGFGFDGWNAAADGTGTNYAAGATFEMPTGNLTLYVKWNGAPVVDAGTNQTVTLTSGVGWTPAQIPIVAWYDADDASTIGLNGSLVTNWLDKSGNGYHGIGNNSPEYLAEDGILGGRPSIGNATTLGENGILLPAFGAKTIYTVAYFDDGTQTTFGNNEYRALFTGDDSANNYRYRVMSNQNGTNWIDTFHFNDAGTYRNGATNSSLAALPMPATLWKFKAGTLRTQARQLGYYPSTSRDWPGRYAEWIFTDGSEDLETEQKIEGYLAHKWGLQANLPADHPYRYAPPEGDSATASLAGTASDPELDTLAIQWSKVSGPGGPITFSNAAALQTDASFTQAGDYTLRLTADDGAQQVSDDVEIRVYSTNSETYTVTYDGNGSDGGAVPVDSTTYFSNDVVTVLGNTGDLVKSGLTFADWNTSADGPGTRYAPGDTFAITVDTTLYARWVGAMVDSDTPHAVLPLAAEHQEWQLVFSDEFNGISVDTNKWTISQSATSRAPRTDRGIESWFWREENVELDGSNLVLNVTKPDTNIMHTGSIESRYIFEPMYGYLEARVDIGDTTKDTHTAFWMQGHEMNQVTGDAHNGAEVDIFESAWFGDYTKSVVHIDGYGADHQASTKQYDTTGIHSGFNVFGLEWTASYMKIYYNGEHKVTYDGIWVPRTNEWVWLSNGASFGDIGTFSEEEIGWLTASKWDYVRVWESTTNLPPVFTVNPMERPLALVDETYSDTIAGSAMDAELDPLTYSKVSGPAWLSVAVDGALSGMPASGDWGTNTWTVQVVDDQGGMDQATLQIIVQNPEDPRLLVGGALLNGDFNANPGETVTFAETEVWYNTRGLQSQVATKSNTTYDGTQNATLASGRGFGVDTGYAMVEGDTFDFSYVWKDDWNWVGASDQVTVSLFITADNTITGARTDLVVDNSGIRQVADTYEAVSRENVYTATASDAGKTLFAAIETDSSGFSRLDNVVLVVNPYVELPPAAPTGLSATPSVGQVDLSWTAVSDATSYRVKRASISGSGYIEIGTPTGTNYTDSVANGATYYYVVSAVNAVGESADSAEVAVTLPHVIPFAEDFEARSLGDLDGQNGWAASNAVVQTNIAIDTQGGSITSATGFAQQAFATSETNVWTDFMIQPVFYQEAPSEIDTNLNALIYFNTNGHPVVYNGTTPQELTNTTVTTGAWIRVTVYSDYAAQQWDLYIDSSEAATGLGFYNSSDTHYQKFSLTGGAADGMAFDDVSIDTVSPLGASFIPAPSDLSATAIDPNQIALMWTDNSTNETGFAIERSLASGSGFASVGSAVADTTNYTDNTCSPGVTYYYRVTATNSEASSLASAEATATTPNEPAPDMQISDGGTLVAVGATNALATVATNEVSLKSFTVTNLMEATDNLLLTGSPAVIFSESGTTNYNGFTIITNITGAATNLAVGEATVFTVQFVTNTVGSYTGTVSIANTDTNKNPYSFTVTAEVSAPKLPATVTLSNTNQVYDSTAREVTVTTSPTGLAVNVTYDGSAVAPTNTGIYAVMAVIDDPGYEGSTNGTLTVSKATPTVTTWPTAATITEGQPVGDATLSGGSASVAGNFSYVNPLEILPTGTNDVPVVFVPTDWINYQSVTGSVAVVVEANLAVTWRSALYPENWMPSDKDAQGRFLHDFSYAGYRKGDSPIPVNPPGWVYDVTAAPYNADNTGSSDATAAIQAAIDDAEAAGGGIVYLPAGTYSVAPGANVSALRISQNGVVLRGAGSSETFIYNTDTYMRFKNVILVQPSSGDWHTPLAGTEILATADIGYPTRTIQLASVTNLSVGDTIIVRADCTADFIADHGMTSLWTDALQGPTICRQITSIDTVSNTITIDIPTRYYMLMRDNARIYKIAPLLEEAGIEDLSVGMLQNPNAGWGDEDYLVVDTGAYEVHGSIAIKFKHARNGWVQRVATYRPTANPNDYHLVSNGIRLDESMHVTVRDTVMQKPQYEGGGGNGYGFILSGSDNLITECQAISCRHNYDFTTMRTTGNVVHRSEGRSSRLASDFHMHLSMGNMFDSMTLNGDNLEAVYRPYGTIIHGHPTTESVFWNTFGEDSGTAVESRQWGWGYVIGTSGGRSGVIRGTADNTAPEDFLEGQGTGDALSPQSLYLDQRARRQLGVLVSAGDAFTVAPDAAVPLSGSVYSYGSSPVSQQWSQVSGPVATFADDSALETTVSLLDDGEYVLKLTAWDGGKTNSATVTVTADSSAPVLVDVPPTAWHYIRGQAQDEGLTPLGYYTSTADLLGTGGAGGSIDDRNVIFGYALPTLSTGATLDGATFQFEITAARDSTGGENLPELHVYLLDSANPTNSGTTYFYHGTLDPSNSVERVGTTSVSISGTDEVPFAAGEQMRSFSLSGDALTLLQSFYDGDTPTQSNVYFRFNMSELPDISGNIYRRYRVNTAIDGSLLELVTSGASTPTYTVNFQPDGTAGATLTGVTNQIVEHGSNGTPVTAHAPAGYQFVDWTLENVPYETGVTVTPVNVTADMTLVANFVTNDALVITADSAEKVYDGTPLTTNGYSITSGTLDAGHTLVSVTVTGSQTLAGVGANVPSDAVIHDESSNDVTASYTVSYANGSLTVTKAASTITVTGDTSAVYNGAGQGPDTAVVNGSTGTVTYSYAGTGTTSYGPSASKPVDVGAYQVVATVAEDANYFGAVSDPLAFSITQATPTITALPSASAIVIGQALSASTLTNGTASVDGTFAFTNPDTVPAAGGTYAASVTFTPTDTANYTTATGLVDVWVDDSVVMPFIEDFEARTLGDLDGQNGWVASNAVVQTNIAIDTQGGSITSATGFAEHVFIGSETNVWTDFMIQPVFYQEAPSQIDTNLNALIYFNTNGHPVVYNGTTPQELTNTTVTTGAWIRVTVHSDYAAQQWDLYIDSSEAATGLGFYNSSDTHYQKFSLTGGAPEGMAFDDVTIDTVSPYAGLPRLTVISAHGSPSPAEGTWTYELNASINAFMPDATIMNGSIQYVCTGWTGSGSGLSSGADTNFSFTITEDTTLTWQWTTNYWIELNTTGE